MHFPRRRFLTSAALGLGGMIVSPLARLLRGQKKKVATLEDFKGVDQLPAGPMVGHTTPTSASIWMYTPAYDVIEVRYEPQSSPRDRRIAELEDIPMQGLELVGRARKATLADLTPDTPYKYEIAVNGRMTAEHRGTFRTPPAAGSPAKFRLGLTSCMKIIKPQDSWLLFLKDKPDLHLTLGDTVYSDTTDSRIQWRYHLQYRQSPLFASVIRAMPTYSMWDDHDFGPDNSHGGVEGKEESLEGWKHVWINPGAGTPEVPGAFYEFSWGDVDFFVVDGRYHRSPPKAKDDEHKTMLGDAQFHWLIERMKASRAKFKIIATGSTLDHSLNDGWRIYTHSRHQLFDAIREHKLSGVVVMTGSLHRTLAWEHHESERVGYPLVEIISSGICNSKTESYATIDFDTTVDDPTMAVRVVLGSGKINQEQTWKLSQLSHT